MAERKWVAGVDGAQKGWIVAYVPLRKGKGLLPKKVRALFRGQS